MITLRGHFDGKVLVPDEPVDLPRNRPLVVHVESADDAPAGGAGSAEDWMIENPIDDPRLPEDGAAQHDHYLYGTPKKP